MVYYAAITRNAFGKGYAWYLGTMLPPEKVREYLLAAAASIKQMTLSTR